MKLEYIIYDIKEILMALKDDTRVKDSYLIHKIINYDCLLKEQMALQGVKIPEQCYTRIPRKKVAEIASADHPDITVSSIKLGKVELPKLINLPESNQNIRITSTSRQTMLYKTTFPMLMHMIRANDYRLQLFFYYVQYGSDLYFYRYIPEVDILALLEDPTEAFTVRSQLFGTSELEVGKEYVVISGAVNENDGSNIKTYTRFQGFTCTKDFVYTGDGKCQLEDDVHQITLQDEYPITRAMAQQIVLQILTKDYQIERQSMPDIYNDAQDDELTRRLKLRTWSGGQKIYAGV